MILQLLMLNYKLEHHKIKNIIPQFCAAKEEGPLGKVYEILLLKC